MPIERVGFLECIEVLNSSITIVGRSIKLDAAMSDPVWQIWKFIKTGILTQMIWAKKNNKPNSDFVHIWDDRDALFPIPILDNPASLLLDGVDENIDLGDNYTFGPATAFSWSFWMKAQNFASQRAMIAKTTQDADVHGYSFQHDNTGKLFAQIRAPGNLRQHTFATILTAGLWYHLCFTYAGGSNINGLKAYINAVAESSPASGVLSGWTVPDPLTFGSRDGTFYFSGNLNQISVWNKALSPTEVTELFNSGAPGNLNSHSAIANLLSWWFLNTGISFPTEVDVIGDVNGTLTNMDAENYDDGDVP